MASLVDDGILSRRYPASELRTGDVVTGDALAVVDERQHGYRITRRARGRWVLAERVYRNLTDRPHPRWRAIGEEHAVRVPLSGVYVVPVDDDLPDLSQE